MFTLNDDNSIYATRGDIVFFSVSAEDDGKPYKFQAGDVVRIKVYGKKDAENVVLQKDFPVVEVTENVDIFLSKEDTKFGEVISKPKDYWYEVELNPGENPQTIIGYDEDGAKVFKLFPEGDDIEAYEPDPEDFPVVDEALDMASPRPVSNSAVSKAIAMIQELCMDTVDAVSKLHVTPQMFGAIGDGVSDDTKAIKDAISAVGSGISILHFPAGTYLVSEDIQLVSNMILQGEGYNAVIKRAGNNLNNYNILLCNGLDNVTIRNIHIQGDRSEHEGTDGEWGMCISLQDCTNIIIEHCKLTVGWGDGVYVGTSMSGTGEGCKDITIDNCIIDHNRRNGVSVIECDGFRLRNSLITNTDGTNPRAGIDFEPNEADQMVVNCLVENCVFSGNLTDISFYDRNAAQVDIRNCKMSSKYGLVYESIIPEEKVTTGGITVINCSFNNQANCFLSSRKHINSAPIRFMGCVLSAETVAIQIGGQTVDYPYEMGDVHFVDCYIAKSPHNTGWIRYQNVQSYPLKNVTLAVRLGDGVLYHNFYTTISKCQLNADIKCEPKTYTNSALTIDAKNTEPLICLDTRNNDCVVSLAHSIPFGMPITIRKLYDGNTVRIVNQAEKFGQFEYASEFEFSGRFSDVTIIHEAAGVWRVVGDNADITYGDGS